MRLDVIVIPAPAKAGAGATTIGARDIIPRPNSQ